MSRAAVVLPAQLHGFGPSSPLPPASPFYRLPESVPVLSVSSGAQQVLHGKLMSGLARRLKWFPFPCKMSQGKLISTGMVHEKRHGRQNWGTAKEMDELK